MRKTLLTLLAIAGCATASGSGGGPVPVDVPATQTPGPGPQPLSAPDLLYVCNQSDATVTLIDTRTNEKVGLVDLTTLGFSKNAKPHHIAVEPDGSFWYVTLIGENKIVKLDRDNKVVGQATFETPGMLSLHPTQDLLFVGRSMTAVNPPKRIGVIKRSDMSIEEVDVLFPRPHAMALDAKDNTVYTASLATNQLAAIDVATERVQIIEVGGKQHAIMQFALSPDGRTLVASGELSAELLVFDVSSPLQPKFVRSFTVEAQPFDPVFTPDGGYVIVGNKAANAISVVDLQKLEVKVMRGPGIAQPHGTAVSPDGRWVYVSNNNLSAPAGSGQGAHAMHAAQAAATPAGAGTIVVIDAHSRRIAKVIEVGHNASGIAVRTMR
ncbi:MAG TPA: beta-propeller fold lactonase family protein [Longimicrobiales bacterium]